MKDRNNLIAIPTPRVGERRYTIHEAPPAGVYNWPQHLPIEYLIKNNICVRILNKK